MHSFVGVCFAEFKFKPDAGQNVGHCLHFFVFVSHSFLLLDSDNPLGFQESVALPLHFVREMMDGGKITLRDLTFHFANARGRISSILTRFVRRNSSRPSGQSPARR